MIDGCKNDFSKLYTTKVDHHISSGFSMFKISLFKDIGNTYDAYKGKNWMEKVLWILKKTPAEDN